MPKVSVYLKVIFIFSLAIYFLYFNMDRPRILILHSYDPTYSWTRDVNVGISRIIEGESYPAFYWQYMDTKRQPDLEYKKKAGVTARRLIDDLKPNVILACDDDAQDFVTRYYVDYPGISIVFCGVNGELMDYKYDTASNVTGILERIPLIHTKTILKHILNKNLKKGGSVKILPLGDTSGTVARDIKQILSFNWTPYILEKPVTAVTFDEWKRAILEANDKSDVILLTNYRQIRKYSEGTDAEKEEFVSARELMEWTVENVKIPMLGNNGFIVEDGAAVAIATSPYEQGEIAASKALSIIRGANPKDLGIDATKQFIVYLRGSEVEKQDLKIPLVYESFARAANKYFD